jgi:hypothetical protein
VHPQNPSPQGRHATLNLLFKEKEHGLYTQDFAKVAGFPRADFEHAYLVGTDFEGEAFVKKIQAYDCNKTATNRSQSYLFFHIDVVKVI